MDKQEAKAKVYDLSKVINDTQQEIAELNKIIEAPEVKKPSEQA